MCPASVLTGTKFLSTLSLRRATHNADVSISLALAFLSTLSLRRATVAVVSPISRKMYFYPRSPCGERHGFLRGLPKEHLFLSTLSLRRATTKNHSQFIRIDISIHALLAESDKLWDAPAMPTQISIHALLAESDDQQPHHPNQTKNFYPRSPCGERPQTMPASSIINTISIHALLAESDWLPDHAWWLRC